MVNQVIFSKSRLYNLVSEICQTKNSKVFLAKSDKPQYGRRLFSTSQNLTAPSCVSMDELSNIDLYAIKNIPLTLAPVSMEARLLNTVSKCRHIISLCDVVIHPLGVFLVCKYEGGGDLAMVICNHLNVGSRIPELKIYSWMSQLIAGLKYIHSLEIFHRDLKPSNFILSTDHRHIYIADFGGAVDARDTTECPMYTTTIGTVYYLSPEVCEGKPFTFESDVWCLGCVLYEMCALEKPFEGSSVAQIVVRILNHCELISERIRSIFSYDEHMQRLCSDMLLRDWRIRPNCVDLMSFQVIKRAYERYLDI